MVLEEPLWLTISCGWWNYLYIGGRYGLQSTRYSTELAYSHFVLLNEELGIFKWYNIIEGGGG